MIRQVLNDNTMIYESSKDYGTGVILMLVIPPVSTQDVADYIRANYHQEVNEGDQMHFTDETIHKGLTNPATVQFIPKNRENTHCE